MHRFLISLFALYLPLALAGCAACLVRPSECDCDTTKKKGAKKLLEWSVCKKDKDKDDSKEPDTGNEQKQNGNGSASKATASDPLENGDAGKQKKPETEKPVQPDDKNQAGAGDKEAAKDKGTKEPNGNGDKAEPEEDEIATDRPDFTESSTTVGKGRIQLESGYTFIRDRGNGTRLTAHSYPEALLRIGMFAEWFELRLGQNLADERAVMPDGSVEAARGAEDLYVGVKLALTEQQKWLPEMSLVPQMFVPSGAPGLSAREVLPGLNWLYGWDVIKDCISFAGSTQANRVRGSLILPVLFDGSGSQIAVNGKHSYLEVAQSLTVGYTLTKKLGAYTEWFAIFPHSALDPEVGPQQYFNGGFTYKFTPNTQYDIRAGVGLNKHADDFFAGTGFSFRY